jgi:hydrophobic/amphiphilic exporter-1 (mainly G- bacteria), HAE1 family
MQKLAEICIKRPVFATMLIMALVVLGIDAYFKLGVDLFPKIEFPFVSVTTVLRGAAPEEVESQVTRRIEEAVNTISGIDDLSSISTEGLSLVSIAFKLEKDSDVAAQEVRDKINRVLGELPQDAEPPIIEKISTDASPIINVVISSDRDLRETTEVVDDRIKKSLETVNGVGQVRFIGERIRQIQIWLDGDKLLAYNLNVDQVRMALASQNVEIPGGRVEQGALELSVRTLGRIEDPREFERIVVANVNGTPIRVSDIGRVTDGVEEPRSLARLNGDPAVLLEVRKQAGTNTLDVITSVKERIDEIRAELPGDYKIAYTRDQSAFIEDSFKAVQTHLIEGGLFAAFIVLLFMRNWRSTLIAAIAIPTSIIATYTLMLAMDFTLNQITMLALVLMVGVVIDDAIVVLENIFRFMEEKGLPPMQAAIEGTKDIGLAVMATTLSLVIIFLPVAFMEGIVGRFMSSFGFTAAFAIMVSLLVSFTLTPMLCSRYVRVSDGAGNHTSKDTWLFKFVSRPYMAMLRWSMNHRWAIVVLAALVMVSVVPIGMNLGQDFLPEDDQSQFMVRVRTPPGSSLAGTTEVINEVEEELKQLPGIRDITVTIGADVQRRVDRGDIILEMVPIAERDYSQDEVMAMARERLSHYHDLVIAVQPPPMIQGGTSEDLRFYVQGPDLGRLEGYSGALMQTLRDTPGVVDVDSTFEPGKPEVRVRINRDKASDLGVSVASVATALRTLVGGDDQVTTYREGEDRYDVQLRVDEEFRNSPDVLGRLFVPSSKLGNVPVSNVATLERATGPNQIERYNRQRQISITANIVDGQSLSAVISILNDKVAEIGLPPEYRSGLIGRSKEFERAGKAYVMAFLLAIVFMYMVLAAQFESFIDPVTILISLPLSIPFALLSLLIAGENFSVIYSSVGIFVLFGIVKKNAILQVDHIKVLERENHLPRLQAIYQGCEDRLRPILMTTASLVAGMTPLALGGGAGSGSRRTVAIVVIGGQTLCLLLSLLVTPVAYSIFEDIGSSSVWGRIGHVLGAPARSLKRALAGTTGAQG